MLALHLDVLSGLVHLTKDLDTLALDFCKGAFLILGLLVADLFGPFSMVLLDPFLTVYKGGLEEVESVVLHLLDNSLTVVPLTVLLFFHQAATEREASLVRSRRKGVIERALISHLVDQIHLDHACRQTVAKLKLVNRENFWHVVCVDNRLWRKWIRLCTGLSA